MNWLRERKASMLLGATAWGEFPDAAFHSYAFSGCFDFAPVNIDAAEFLRRSAQHDSKRRK
jgi:hypothetical protein